MFDPALGVACAACAIGSWAAGGSGGAANCTVEDFNDSAVDAYWVLGVGSAFAASSVANGKRTITDAGTDREPSIGAGYNGIGDWTMDKGDSIKRAHSMNAGVDITERTSHRIQVTYAPPLDLLRRLRAMGVTPPAQPSTRISRTQLAELVTAYERFHAAPGGIRASWELVLCVAPRSTPIRRCMTSIIPTGPAEAL